MTNCLLLCFIVLVGSCFASSEICPGCAIDKDPNDKEVFGHLTSILSKQNSGDAVSKVLAVKTQVVSGVKTTVDFLTANTVTKSEKKCHLVYLSQPWISPEPHILEFNCKLKDRAARQTVGGLRGMDSQSQEIALLGDVVTRTFDELDADNTMKRVVEVQDAKQQIVNGIMYHLRLEVKSTSCPEGQEPTEKCLNDEIEERKICKVTIHRSFTDDSPSNAKLVSSECLAKDRTGLGVPVTVSANDKYIAEVVNFAVKHLNLMSNSIYLQAVKNVLKAETQLISGTMINLVLEVGNTECTKNGHTTDKCEFLPDQSETICRISVLDKSKEMKIVSMKCESHRSKRSTPLGGEQEVDVNDAKIQDLKGYIANELSQRANSLQTKTVVKVLKATTQVLSGRLTQVSVEVADTNCLKSENKDPSECVTSEQGRQICEITIWEKPWLNKIDITRSECHSIQGTDVNPRSKRSPGLLEDEETDKHLSDFIEFVKRERKIYSSSEELGKRFRIFRANMVKAAKLQEYEQGTGIYGATKFSDLTAEEFKKYLGYNHDPDYVPKKPMKTAVIPNITIPASFDWRDHNAVTPVKNQGLCGSCWAFSVTGNIEGVYAIMNGNLTSFSEQELLDCDKYDAACNGGLFDTAYHAIEDLGGLEMESEYPYHGHKETCHFQPKSVKVTISGGMNISQDETEMAKFLVANGPISIALNANAMQFYMGGVSHPFKFLCNPKNLDHGVLIVGYGTHNYPVFKKTLPYWLIKNSWGDKWGVQGYYMVYRGDGTCGVNQTPCTAILSD